MEGGLVVTDDEEIHHILLSLRSHGWTRHLPKINKVTGTKVRITLMNHLNLYFLGIT